MARGNRVPAGVRYFDGEGTRSDTKGSRHPDGVNAGPDNTRKVSGSPPSLPSNSAKGVDAGGTGHLRGKHKSMTGARQSGPGGNKGQKACPDGVAKHDGKSAGKIGMPHKGKQSV